MTAQGNPQKLDRERGMPSDQFGPDDFNAPAPPAVPTPSIITDADLATADASIATSVSNAGQRHGEGTTTARPEASPVLANHLDHAHALHKPVRPRPKVVVAHLPFGSL